MCQLNQMPANSIDALFFGASLKVPDLRYLPTRSLIFLFDIAPLFESEAHSLVELFHPIDPPNQASKLT